MNMNYCVFCSKNFDYALEPVLGFATAKACKGCNETFGKQIQRNTLAIIRDYWKKTHEEKDAKSSLR